MNTEGPNLFPVINNESDDIREVLLKQRGAVIWLTGLSGSGKSTLALAAQERLLEAGHVAFVLDGDNIRCGLNSDLGFSPEDRCENIRRIGEVAKLFADAGLLVFVSFISPYRKARLRAKKCVGPERFVEVFVNSPLEVCEQRDPKGLYLKARSGQISNFTGIGSPYEVPEHPALVIDTASQELGLSVDLLVAHLKTHYIIQV